MGKCKNTECSNETTGKRVYCSLTCRNVFVNKHLRDYTKNGEGLSLKHKEGYLKNPSFCKNPECNKKLPYKKRSNVYCNNSCSAKHTNKDREGMKYNMTEEGIKSIAEASINRTTGDSKSKIRYNDKPNKCINCGGVLEYRFRKRKFCKVQCRREYERKDMDEYQIYKRECQFKFSLNDFPDEFDFSLVEKYGWYMAKNRGDNLNGVSRDHKLSIREGFDLGVDPELISHPANCQLLRHNDNVSKNKKSDITEEKLKSLIKEWDKKYK